MLRAGARPPDAGEGSSTSAAPPAADAERLHATLNEYLMLETKFQPRLALPVESENGEVTTGARDGAAHVLRCLKVWFDLPASVLIHAINLFDRFLTKMKVRPCHVPCITVACMNIALDQHAATTRQPRTVSVEELVSVSQSACTAGDVCRMSGAVGGKLPAACAPLTALEWLRLFRELVGNIPEESELVNLLEIIVCDYACVNARTSELALVLIYHKIEQQYKLELSQPDDIPAELYALYEVGMQIQIYCQMSSSSLLSTQQRVRHVIGRYEARAAASHRQRLVWRLSERTLKVLRPTDRLTSLLPTIEEQQLAADAQTPRKRSASESSESVDMSDWPRSPVLPVYCEN